MRDFLVVLLEAPLASFGEEAGNSQRGTANRPTRSSLLGLVGAALGILRSDVEGQKKLSRSLSTSTRTLSSGVLVRDFHTYESIPQAKGSFMTRRQALGSGEAITSITQREYRSGGVWQAAYVAGPATGQDSLSLELLADAFLTPKFTLWLGRKSCPLSAPVMPRIIAAESLAQAFHCHAEQVGRAAGFGEGVIFTDNNGLLPNSKVPLRHNRRNDEPLNRSTWTFIGRDEWEFMTTDETDSGHDHKSPTVTR